MRLGKYRNFSGYRQKHQNIAVTKVSVASNTELKIIYKRSKMLFTHCAKHVSEIYTKKCFLNQAYTARNNSAA